MIVWVPVLHWSVSFFRQLRLRLEALSHEGGETECEPGDPERPGTLPETVGCLVEDIGNAMMQ